MTTIFIVSKEKYIVLVTMPPARIDIFREATIGQGHETGTIVRGKNR